MDFGIPRPTTPNTVMYDGAEDSTDNLHNALAKKYGSINRLPNSFPLLLLLQEALQPYYMYKYILHTFR